MAIESTLKQAYEFATEDDEGKVCDNLPDEACQEVSGNLFLNLVDRMATKLADQLANPGLVLPWLLDSVGAPAAVIGFLTPVRWAGALLPQLAGADQIRRFPIREWFWLASVCQNLINLAWRNSTVFYTVGIKKLFNKP